MRWRLFYTSGHNSKIIKKADVEGLEVKETAQQNDRITRMTQDLLDRFKFFPVRESTGGDLTGIWIATHSYWMTNSDSVWKNMSNAGMRKIRSVRELLMGYYSTYPTGYILRSFRDFVAHFEYHAENYTTLLVEDFKWRLVYLVLMLRNILINDIMLADLM